MLLYYWPLLYNYFQILFQPTAENKFYNSYINKEKCVNVSLEGGIQRKISLIIYEYEILKIGC